MKLFLFRGYSTSSSIIKPPFTEETAKLKVKVAEDAWNSKDPVKVSLAYTEDSMWRNRSIFIQGRSAIQEFLKDKWEKELHYCLKKHYFTHSSHRIAVTFQYEYQNADDKKWYRAYGNELWTFADDGRMKIRNASINDVQIQEEDRVIQKGKDLSFLETGVCNPKNE